jgi:hypothetical protein
MLHGSLLNFIETLLSQLQIQRVVLKGWIPRNIPISRGALVFAAFQISPYFPAGAWHASRPESWVTTRWTSGLGPSAPVSE